MLLAARDLISTMKKKTIYSTFRFMKFLAFYSPWVSVSTTQKDIISSNGLTKLSKNSKNQGLIIETYFEYEPEPFDIKKRDKKFFDRWGNY